ncbi:MAG: heat-inducible transcription repressor HrcA [Thermotogaceae bacterium]|nr:heat-inducible transcription repressor HrcA [Thermotogaceae bacterium]
MRRDEERIYRVLFSIVKEYIKTKKPVSSKRVLQVTNLNWSSATVRNDMKKLEEMGYVFQPHTSAGRIPTDKGLRFYLDEIVKFGRKEKEQVEIEATQRFPIGDLNSILTAISKILSKGTGGLSIITKPNIENLKLLKVYVTPVGEGMAVITVITELGISKVVPVSRVGRRMLEALEKLMNLFSGMYISSVIEKIEAFKPESEEEEAFIELTRNILRLILSEDRVIYSGMYEIVKNKPGKIEPLVKILENPKKLDKLFEKVKDGIVVFIGEENPVKDLKNFSTFVAPYYKGSDLVGHVALVTNKFVEYEKVIPSVEFITNRLTEYLTVTSRR